MGKDFVNFEFTKDNEFFIFNCNNVIYVDSVKKGNSYIISIGFLNGAIKSLEFSNDEFYVEAKRKLQKYFCNI